MKKLLFCLLITWGFTAKAQVYNNEWIDYSKTYYKFKLARNGVFRIPYSVLSTAGLGTAPAEHFQLWRNGKQVPIYTSVSNGVMGASDYIEFWGQMNDGKPDNELYREADYQLNDKWSLITDSSSYFLTTNTNVSENLRLQNTINDVASNSLPAEPYFMHTIGNYFRHRVVRDTIVNGVLVSDTLWNHPQLALPRTNKDVYISNSNAGYAINVGTYLYSSSYDKGEGWTSAEIQTRALTNGSRNIGRNAARFKNLFVYNGGPSPKFRINLSGNAINSRRYLVTINGDSVIGNQMDFFNYAKDSTQFSLSTLANNQAIVTVTNLANVACYPSPVGCQTDRMVIHQYEIEYPRQFNFGGQANFEFSLPASASGNYLEITNFSYGSSAPVLYDLTNGQRYVADLSSAPVLKFALQPSTSHRSLILVSQENNNISTINSLQTRNFIDYTALANQGDYMIITNPVLFIGSNGNNPVDEYKQYRSSPEGGGFNAQVYQIDEIVDQFGFGIKKHPAAIRNLVLYARHNYQVAPKNVFIIGRGVNYAHQKSAEFSSDVDLLNLVPTFGWPASDILLVADKGSSQPEVPVGRLSAINGGEVEVYLKKVKEHELAQKQMSANIDDKGWMKNVVHIVGASEPGLETQLSSMMDNYGSTISDTLFGANVTKFSKSSSDAITQLNSTVLENLFTDGITIMTYFGHSSSTTLEFNLDNPENYNNTGKYPIFIGLGCNVGDFYKYSPLRLQVKETLSEKYVLAPDRGMIAMIASTHFGIVHYLDVWASRAYKNMAYKSYGRSIGEMMMHTAEDVFQYTTQEDFYARCNTEQSQLHGDPALLLNPHQKADYVIEDAMVKVNPGFVSVFDHSFNFKANYINIGKAPSDSIIVEVKRQVQNQPAVIIKRDTIPGVRFIDSLSIDIDINPTTDKGLNKITVTIDADNEVDEYYENNNSITKEVFIYEDELRPVFPYEYAIVTDANIKLKGSTANPFSPSKEYQVEIDTTELFNSPLKVRRTATSAGGVVEFDPGMSFTDSTVYYWRISPVTTGIPTWNYSSFVYLPNLTQGFNQSHFYQHANSTGDGISLDATTKKWKYGTRYANIFIRQGTWVTSTGQEAGLSVAINGGAGIRNTCAYQSLVFNVFDPVTFEPWTNVTSGVNDHYQGGLYGSATTHCNSGRRWNFEYRWDSVNSRKEALDFMRDTIPDGAYVIVRSFLLDPVTYPQHAMRIRYADQWRTEDEAEFGAGNSIYYALKNAGFSGLDSFYKPRNFAFIYKKNDPSFTPKWVVSAGTMDNVTLTADCGFPDTVGYINSPVFGPAKEWKTMHWRGESLDAIPGDFPRVSVIGIRQSGEADTLMSDLDVTQQDVDISSISAVDYPFVQLRMRNSDSTNNTPYQLRYWRLTYIPVPEGSVAANAYFSMKDTTDVAEPLEFKIAFKNVSETAFPDSILVKTVITDRNNVQHILPPVRYKPLGVSDTIHIKVPIDSRSIVGSNSLFVEVNPGNDQPEQYHFNNFVYRNFFVRGDTLNPVLDVTFDNVHILNRDIVSSKPNILIKLKDEARWYLLNDPSKLEVQVRQLSTGQLRQYAFNSDTLTFVPAQQAPTNDNTATAVFKPYFEEDGEYELVVTGKDMSENGAGKMEYRVNFQVINKPMISNMLNYPNPFTTSTAFVFTVTGSEVPQNIRIQILTVTGKIVREITKEELGPIHIGRNITEFKWDGTDQYGQKLANGVYLYRVITNLNGKSLDKYTSDSDNTDKYFNKGYGKMYLMR